MAMAAVSPLNLPQIFDRVKKIAGARQLCVSLREAPHIHTFTDRYPQ
jgi:hypothetical protein